MFLTTNPIPVKTAMNLLGREAGPMRMPMELASGKVLDELKSALKTYGIKINKQDTNASQNAERLFYYKVY